MFLYVREALEQLEEHINAVKVGDIKEKFDFAGFFFLLIFNFLEFLTMLKWIETVISLTCSSDVDSAFFWAAASRA